MDDLTVEDDEISMDLLDFLAEDINKTDSDFLNDAQKDSFEEFDDMQIESSDHSIISPKKIRKLPDWTKDPTELRIIKEHRIQQHFKNKGEFREEACEFFQSKSSLDLAFPKELTVPEPKGRVICFDLETSGFTTNDSIIEFGAVELIDGFRTGCIFQSYAKPKGTIHPMATKAHDLTNDFLKNAPPIEEFIGSSTLVAHNLKFDLRMLKQELDRIGLKNQTENCFCTQRYFQKNFQGYGYSLDSVASYFGVNKVYSRKSHGALIDSENA